jgi:hypothetical protein
VHLRRALLLFAIVLALAAIAASVSRPNAGSERGDQVQTTPTTTDPERTVAPSNATPPPVELTFVADDPHPQRIQAGQAATVMVEVERAGQVEISDLGMSAVADPLTPGRFEVLTREVGRHPITFAPAGAEAEGRRVGTLVVTAE